VTAAVPSGRNAGLCVLAFMLAVAGPLLLNLPLPPAIGHTGQIAAVFGWGLVLLLVPAPTPSARTVRAAAPLLAVLAIAAVACIVSILTGGLPASPGVATLGVIAMAAVIALHAASWGAVAPSGVFKAFAWALVSAGLCGAFMAVVQVFDPARRTDTFIALASSAGRASGNIGQANQFADTLLWALIALLALAQPRDGTPARPVGVRLLVALAVQALLLGTVLTGSRTGFVAIVLLALWGLLDRGLSRDSRILLGTGPVSASVMIWLVRLWLQAHVTDVQFLQHASPDITAFRSEIWSQSLTLIANQPWLGVGWGQFNFAWTLTPFASRGAGLVSNAHNLPLQLAVELGVPIALLLMGLLLWTLWFTFRRLRRLPGATGVHARAVLIMVVVIGLHSMLEYPLWFAYLLFPAAWAWGLALGVAASAQDVPVAASVEAASAASPLRTWRIAGLLMVVTGVSAWFDYLNIVSLYVARPGMPSFEQRIRNEQASPLFSSLADYVATIHPPPQQDMLPTIQRSSHVLFNGWLMLSWANALDAQGQTDKARFLAARLREFKLDAAKRYFGPCTSPDVVAKPYQCVPPSQAYTWHDFKPS